MTSVVAVDLGGTKLTTAVVDRDGRVSGRTKRPVARTGLDDSVRQIAAAIHDSLSASPDADVQGVGLIVPGIFNKGTGEAWAPNLWGHADVPLMRELRSALEVAVTIDSDRAGYVLGEQWLGVARGLNDVIFLAVGTGIGAGILSGGRLIDGAGGVAGAVGWFAVNPQHREEYSRVGCWEAEAAGPALAQRLNAASAEAVVAAARDGDSFALAAIEETARYLGIGIANLVSVLNSEMIVLGGGLMQAGDLFLPAIRRVMPVWAQPVSAQQVRIELTQLGEDAGLLGAARLALNAIGI
ncbi:MAG: ROK family protein [Bryobacteraceae bacterium]|nr:ROK family protein [Bryobacteraceae bacterium]